MLDIEKEMTSTKRPYASNESLIIKCNVTAPVRVGNGWKLIESFMVVEDGIVSLLGKRTSISLGIFKLGLTEEVNERNHQNSTTSR